MQTPLQSADGAWDVLYLGCYISAECRGLDIKNKLVELRGVSLVLCYLKPSLKSATAYKVLFLTRQGAGSIYLTEIWYQIKQQFLF